MACGNQYQNGEPPKEGLQNHVKPGTFLQTNTDAIVRPKAKGEFHMNNPDMARALHKAVQNKEPLAYEERVTE